MSCWSCFHRLGVYVRDIQSKACFPNAQPTVVGFKQSERQNLFKSQILKKASICLVICKTKSTPFEIGWYPTNVHDWGKNQGARNRVSSVGGRQRRFRGGRRTVLDGTSHAEGKYVQLQWKTRPIKPGANCAFYNPKRPLRVGSRVLSGQRGIFPLPSLIHFFVQGDQKRLWRVIFLWRT